MASTAAAPVSVALRSRTRRILREAIGRELRRIKREAQEDRVAQMSDAEFEQWLDGECAKRPWM